MNFHRDCFRVEDAIEILECVLKLREEKLGIANPDFEDEKRRLAELLKEAGKTRDRKAKSLKNLIDPNSKKTKKAELIIMSMITGRAVSARGDLCLCANPRPAKNATRKSSTPRTDASPTENTAARR